MTALTATVMHRIAPCPHKHFSCVGDEAARLVSPYIHITADELAAISELAEDSDVVLLDGYRQATWGMANGYPVLMPLARPLH